MLRLLDILYDIMKKRQQNELMFANPHKWFWSRIAKKLNATNLILSWDKLRNAIQIVIQKNNKTLGMHYTDKKFPKFFV